MKNLEAQILDRLVARTMPRRNKRGALDLEDATPQERSKLIGFVAAQVPTMDDASVAYGMYAVDALDHPDVKALREALALSYRKRILSWFSYAIQNRAQQGGGGSGLKRLKDGIAAFIEDLPAQLLKGYKPMSQYIAGNITDVIDGSKLDAVSAKVYRVLEDSFKTSGLSKTAKGDLFDVLFDAPNKVWYIPSSYSTFPVKDALSRAGLRWNMSRKRWEAPKITRSMAHLVEIPPSQMPAKPPAKPVAPVRGPVGPTQTQTLPQGAQGTLVELMNWFFGAWLPANIGRFDKVFNTYLRSAETSYAFKFTLANRKVEVDIDRDLQGPRDAVEELRYRYLGRQGRQPWLEVLDRYVDLTKTTNTKAVIGLIDRMNNLQHSNGLFLEQFPKKVQAWYTTFLDRKYSAKTAYILAGFIGDSDLRDLIRWFDAPKGMDRDKGQLGPDIPIEQKKLPPNEVNWREKGYPYEKGFKPPSRQAPEVQRDLGHLPGVWEPKAP